MKRTLAIVGLVVAALAVASVIGAGLASIEVGLALAAAT